MIDEETTPEFQTESLISRYQNNTMSSAFMTSPMEVIKIGEPLSNSNEIKQALKNGEIYKQGFEDARKRYERPNGKWITIEAGENFLENHEWYLVVHKDYGTPMKAKYHSDCPRFTFFDARGEEASYLFENKITHYMKLPDIPIGGTE